MMAKQLLLFATKKGAALQVEMPQRFDEWRKCRKGVCQADMQHGEKSKEFKLAKQRCDKLFKEVLEELRYNIEKAQLDEEIVEGGYYNKESIYAED